MTTKQGPDTVGLSDQASELPAEFNKATLDSLVFGGVEVKIMGELVYASHSSGRHVVAQDVATLRRIEELLSRALNVVRLARANYESPASPLSGPDTMENLATGRGD